MTLHLSAEREQLVRSFIQTGQFSSEDEVIDAALLLLQQQDEETRLADRRREIAIGIDQADRGELGPFDPHASLARTQLPPPAPVQQAVPITTVCARRIHPSGK